MCTGTQVFAVVLHRRWLAHLRIIIYLKFTMVHSDIGILVWGFEMQSGLAAIAFFVVAASWIFVIGHQLGLSGFNPNRYAVLEGTIAIAYTVSAISLCAVVSFVVVAFVRR